MNSYALPRVNDFFPRTRRGHGSTHPTPRYDKSGALVRNACPCVDDTCGLNRPKSNNPHEDQKANVADWKEAHKFRENAPLEICYSRELAR